MVAHFALNEDEQTRYLWGLPLKKESPKMKDKILERADKIAWDYGYADYNSAPSKFKVFIWREAHKKVAKKSFIRRFFRV